MSGMEDRSDDRGGVGAADHLHRRGHAGDRPFRQYRPRGLSMARLQLNGITKVYGDFKAADDVSLDIADGEFLVLLRPSASANTTTFPIPPAFIHPTPATLPPT